MTTMTSVYQQFLADLSARVKAGTTTAEDIAWLTEATVKLGGSAAAEQEMLAAVNKALATGEANFTKALETGGTHLTAAKTALESATTQVQASSTLLDGKTAALASIPTMAAQQPTMTRTAQVLRGFCENDYYQNNAMMGASYNNSHRSQPLNFQYLDQSTGKLYSAYFNYHCANNRHALNIHYGYWLDGEFVTIYRRNTSHPDRVSDFAYSSAGSMYYLSAWIMPLAKSDDPDDIRIALIIAPIVNSRTTDATLVRAVISVDQDDANLVVYKGGLTPDAKPAGGGNEHPLRGIHSYAAYNKQKHRWHGLNAVQYWDSAVGLASDHPAFNYPSGEIRNTDKYIEFSGYRQNGLPATGRFIFDTNLGNQHPYSVRGSRRSNLSYSYTPWGNNNSWWYDGSGGQFFPGSRNELAYEPTRSHACYGGNNSGRSAHMWSYLVGDADFNVEVNQLIFTPDIVVEYADSSHFNRRFKGMQVTALNSHNQTIASLYLPRELTAVKKGVTRCGLSCANTGWLVQAVDPQRGYALALTSESSRLDGSPCYPILYKF